MKKFLQTSLHYAKQFFLATFYGFRQAIPQVLCYWIFEWMANLMGFYYFDEEFGCECLLGFTMIYYWITIFIPKHKPFVRFIVPYISWIVIMYTSIGFGRSVVGYLLMSLLLPFVSHIFFVLEDYLKKVLIPRQKIFKRAKIIVNTFSAITLALFVFVVYPSIAEKITSFCKPSCEHLFDEAKELSIATGLDFPEYKVLKYTKNYVRERGIYCDELEAEFIEKPSEEFFNTIDSLYRMDDSRWELLHGEIYSYSLEKKSPDGHHPEQLLTVNLRPVSKKFYIYFGGW